MRPSSCLGLRSAMFNCREQVQSAIQATGFHSRGTYSWFGRPSPRLTAHFERVLSKKFLQKWLLSTLQSQLYSDFYCQGTAMPTMKESSALAHPSVGSFIDALSSSNCGAGYWAEGWQITSLGDNEIVASKNGLAFRAQREDCTTGSGELLNQTSRVLLHRRERC